MPGRRPDPYTPFGLGSLPLKERAFTERPEPAPLTGKAKQARRVRWALEDRIEARRLGVSVQELAD